MLHVPRQLEGRWAITRQRLDTSWEFIANDGTWTTKWIEARLFDAPWMANETFPSTGDVRPASDVYDFAVATAGIFVVDDDSPGCRAPAYD